MIKNWLLSLFGPSPRFNIGDSVQKINGEQELMVVVEINKVGNEETLVRCKWFDSAEKRDKTAFLPEKELEPFDWYHPKKRVQA